MMPYRDPISNLVSALIDDLDYFLHQQYSVMTKPDHMDIMCKTLTAIGTYYYDQGLHDVDEIKDAIRFRLQSYAVDTTEFNLVYRRLLGLWDGEWK